MFSKFDDINMTSREVRWSSKEMRWSSKEMRWSTREVRWSGRVQWSSREFIMGILGNTLLAAVYNGNSR